MGEIERYVQRLSRYQSSDTVQNFYRGRGRVARACRSNLIRWLKELQARQPRWALIGEAPGYRGCARTGIPFSSEALVEQGLELSNGQRLFGADYQLSEAESRVKEATATMIWEFLAQHSAVPLTWNAFPFHPHPVGQPLGNRKPNAAECHAGAQYLKELLKLYPIHWVVAVGRVAQGLCHQHLRDVEIISVRHPSFGGKADFIAGMQQFLLGTSEQD